MKSFVLSFCFLCSFFVTAQELDWPVIIPSTGADHTILFTLTQEITLNDAPIDDGAVIGAFYLNDDGALVCGGFTNYQSFTNITIAAIGDDSTTENKDGFEVNESFVLYIQINGIDYPLIADYNLDAPFTDTYSVNGLSKITSLTIVEVSEDLEGCTDPLYIEYNPLASADTDPTSCLTEIILGCTSESAFNFNPTANVDDGSCIEETLGCTNSAYAEFNPAATNDTDPSSCITDATFGCTVESALNFDPTANVNDGSCILVVEGCLNDAFVEFNPSATVDDGSCLIVVIAGCTDPDYVEYFEPANTDNGTCSVFVNGGCTDPNYLQYNPTANNDDGSCLDLTVEGCIDENYLEYNSEANLDDGSCAVISFSGCTDVLADNYNLLANLDDGSCDYLGCTDPLAFNYDEIATLDNGSCESVLLGCTNPEYLEYNPQANTNDNSCLNIIILGCTDQLAFNYFVLANVDDGSCIENIGGCMDTLYESYNPLATFDDGSCLELIIEGCTDSTAFNYNGLAVLDDGSCTYNLLYVTYENIGVATFEFDVDLLELLDFNVLWNIGDIFYSNAESFIYSFESNGTYTVSLTATNGSLLIFDEFTIVIDIPGLTLDEVSDQLLSTEYIDLLGRRVLHPLRGHVYIRFDNYESGTIIRSKELY
ncbi:MAG: hypothetical protein QNK65_03895 [Flavobacteriales bacterium]